MAVRRVWIKCTVITLATFLLLFTMLQLGLTAAVNYIFGNDVELNSSIEDICIALFLMPAVWVGYAAAMTRHRGVYVTLIILTSLSLMSSSALIFYEGYVFGSALYYTNYGVSNSGLMITKLLTWSLTAVLLIVLLGVAIAGTCSGRGRKKAEFSYYRNHGMPTPMAPYSLPPTYASRPQSKPVELSRDYPRMTTPSRYFEHAPSPRAFYPKYY